MDGLLGSGANALGVASRTVQALRRAAVVAEHPEPQGLGIVVPEQRADPDMAQEMLERFFEPVMAAKEQDRPRTKMLVQAALEDVSVSQAMDWVKKYSEVVQEAYDYARDDK